jgi:hypothetical protein
MEKVMTLPGRTFAWSLDNALFVQSRVSERAKSGHRQILGHFENVNAMD